MDAAKQMQGGVVIHPVLQNGKKKDIEVVFNVETEMKIELAFARLITTIPDFKLAISEPSYDGMLKRFLGRALMLSPYDILAILIGCSDGDLTIDECKTATVSRVDREKIAAAIAGSLSKDTDFEPEKWEKLNSATSSPEVQEAAKDFIPASLVWPKCLGCKHAKSTVGQEDS